MNSAAQTRSFLLFSSLLAALAASAASINYTGGVTNAASATGPSWVLGTNMYIQLVEDYASSPLGSSGAAGSSQNGFNLFDPLPGGGGLDITKLTWTFGTLDLQGVGVGDSQTVSPTPVSAGVEDYRYSGVPTNLTFFYDGVEWASGKVTQFLITVPNSNTAIATGSGSAVLTANTAAGQDFWDEINALTSGAMQIDFTAGNFNSVGASPANATFTSDGTLTPVPEPSAWASFAGIAALAFGLYRLRHPR